jgi:zinc transport system substrate-binding protein
MQRLIYLLFLIVFIPAQEKYVTTIQPFAVILEEITGSQVTCLLKAGDSPHTHALRPSSVKEVQIADFFFYGHDHLDGWASELSAKQAINLYSLLPADYRLVVKSYFGKSRGSIVGEDPHFWTDPMVVNALIPALVDTLCDHLPSKCTVFKKNVAPL